MLWCIQILIALTSFGFLNADPPLLELGDGNFDTEIENHDIALVKFYAPWCGHCKKMAPDFQEAANILAADDPPVQLIKVDCTVHTKVCGKHGVSGYPTLKIFRGSAENAEDYSGPRDKNGIIKYMKGKAGPTAKDLKTVADVEKFIGGKDHAIVCFLSSEDSKVKKEFTKVADALSEDFKFGYTADPEAVEKYGYTDEIVIYQPKRLQNKFDPTALKYEGDVKTGSVKKFINDNIHGFAGHRTTDNQGQFKNPLVVAYYNVDYEKDVKGTNYWRNRVMKVAKKLKEEGRTINFAVSSKADFGHEMDEFNIKGASDKPAIAGKDASGQKFVMADEFSMDALEKFCNDLLDDKLEPYLKSEAVPEQTEPVKILVAKNFNDIVQDDKDVLMEFYAPWCGHCKSLAPKYDELAKKLEDEDTVVIAKMDATANDVPKPYDVRGFPTLYFKPAGQKAKKYEGGREVKDFITYLAKETTHKLKGYSRSGKKIKSEL
jgi:protein disulfide isomerase family A protein 3